MENLPSHLPHFAPIPWTKSDRPTREWSLDTRPTRRPGHDDCLLDSLRRAGCRQRSFEPGCALIEAGEVESAMFVIVSGEAEVRLGAATGLPLDTVMRGDIVGEMSIVDDTAACAFVVAVQPTCALEVPRARFWSIVESSHVFARRLLETLARRLRANNETVARGAQQQEELLHVANRDKLTGLRNRRWLDAQLEVWAAERRSIGQPLALGLLDVDHFKRFNDTYGHQAGDTVLRAFGQALESCLRATDAVVRWGGEEFAVVMPGAPQRPAVAALERMRQAVSKLRCYAPTGEPLPGITFSAGVVAVESFEPAKLVETADALLYQAKRQGRNRVLSTNVLRS